MHTSCLEAMPGLYWVPLTWLFFCFEELNVLCSIVRKFACWLFFWSPWVVWLIVAINRINDWDQLSRGVGLFKYFWRLIKVRVFFKGKIRWLGDFRVVWLVHEAVKLLGFCYAERYWNAGWRLFDGCFFGRLKSLRDYVTTGKLYLWRLDVKLL
jgi:hypothetical protein